MSFELDTTTPGPEALAIAEKELRETENNKKEGLAALKKYIEDDKTLYFRTDEVFLLIFLRPCKFYAKSAFELMKRTAEFKDKNAALLSNLMPSDEKVAMLEHNVVNAIKGRDHKNRRILVVNCGKSWDPSAVSADQVFRVLYLVHQLAIWEPLTQIYGTVVIMDFEGLSMKQVMGMTPSFCMKLLTFIQEAMPLRLKEVHFVKQPFLFNMVWQMFKPFVKEKLRKRMFFHGNKMSSLHAYIPASHISKNYGGNLPEIDYTSADWYPILLQHEDKVKEWNSYGYRKSE
ncbi:clavesin-2 [Bombus pyrosoma]|uniref:clavesin-2 n=1 Tax=Bombus pyrosoma TaxID=396416 RepID=UPI001CB9B345|nr:clavesin-2 [Bombus pyrosoma]